MNLNEEKITVSIGLDSLAYILTSEFDRGTFLEFIEFMAGVNADSNFEWEVIEVLFARLLDADPEAARDLLSELEPGKEVGVNDRPCYSHDGIGRVLFWPKGRSLSKPYNKVADHVDSRIVDSIVIDLNRRKNDG